jgi:L-fuconolactonase
MARVTIAACPAVASLDNRRVRIDAHQHFWHYSPAEYPWIGAGMQAIARDFLPDDLAQQLTACDLDCCIAVQARSSAAETRFLLDLARDHAFVAGVVGWIDLCAPDADDVLAALADEDRLCGLRHIVQDEPDDFLAHPDFRRGVGLLARHGLVYDLLIYPRQLDLANAFVRAFPDQPFVLDHLAKPDVTGQHFDDWLRGFRALAECDNVSCKLSGLVTEAKWHAWRPDDFRRYLDAALDAFGEHRLLFGSDWPVCLLAAHDYRAVYTLVADWAGQLSQAARASLFGGNAARTYGLS